MITQFKIHIDKTDIVEKFYELMNCEAHGRFNNFILHIKNIKK